MGQLSFQSVGYFLAVDDFGLSAVGFVLALCGLIPDSWHTMVKNHLIPVTITIQNGKDSIMPDPLLNSAGCLVVGAMVALGEKVSILNLDTVGDGSYGYC